MDFSKVPLLVTDGQADLSQAKKEIVPAKDGGFSLDDILQAHADFGFPAVQPTPTTPPVLPAADWTLQLEARNAAAPAFVIAMYTDGKNNVTASNPDSTPGDYLPSRLVGADVRWERQDDSLLSFDIHFHLFNGTPIGPTFYGAVQAGASGKLCIVAYTSDGAYKATCTQR